MENNGGIAQMKFVCNLVFAIWDYIIYVSKIKTIFFRQPGCFFLVNRCHRI